MSRIMVAAALGAALLAAPGAEASPKPPTAGLTRPVAAPAPPSGESRSIVEFGATPGDASDDDAPAIQSAIDAAEPGDEVFVPNGVFHVKTRKIALRTGVSVRGASRTGAVLHAAFAARPDGKNAYVLYAAPGTNNLTLSGFQLTSNGSTATDTALHYGIWLGDGDSACQPCNDDIAPVHRIRVTDVDVNRFTKMGLNIRNGHDITMDDNRVHAALSDGGGGFGYGIMLGYDQTANNWIHHNVIERGAGKLRHGILLQYRAHHNLIERNMVRDLSEDGIDLHGEDEYANEVAHNVVHGSARAGFGVGNTGGSTEHGASGPDNWIHHNEVYDSQQGLRLIMGSDRTRIEHNHFHDNDEFGIQVNNGGGDDLTISCNRIHGTAVGIRLEETAGTVVECNDVTANSSESLRVTESVTDYTVRHNDFRGAPVTVDSSDGSYTGNCDDENGTTTCRSTCTERKPR